MLPERATRPFSPFVTRPILLPRTAHAHASRLSQILDGLGDDGSSGDGSGGDGSGGNGAGGDGSGGDGAGGDGAGGDGASDDGESAARDHSCACSSACANGDLLDEFLRSVEQEHEHAAAAEEGVSETSQHAADPKVPPGVIQSRLPDDWVAHLDPASGHTYYYHQATDERTWVRPTEC